MAKQATTKAEQEAAQKPYLLVTHMRPDTDALCCLWLADRLGIPVDAPRKIVFIESSTRLSEEEEKEGCEVLYMDVGGGPCDQHGKKLERASSFQLTMKHFGFDKSPDLSLILEPILELTRASDNVERISRTDLHYILKALPHKHNNGSGVDWMAVCNDAFWLLDMIFGQQEQRVKSMREFEEKGEIIELPNGLKVAPIFRNPGWREAAYDKGADVVMWTIPQGKGRFYVGIQVHRDSKVSLQPAMCAIRFAEAKKRDIKLGKKEASALLTITKLPGWHLHDSGRLILSGSRSHSLQKGEFTQLSPHAILKLVLESLGT